MDNYELNVKPNSIVLTAIVIYYKSSVMENIVLRIVLLSWFCKYPGEYWIDIFYIASRCVQYTAREAEGVQC